jgi:hypothetical protein
MADMVAAPGWVVQVEISHEQAAILSVHDLL